MWKFLVVVDQTPECLIALRFAARRAERIGVGVSMLYVVEPDEFQHWAMVAQRIREEALEEAQARLDALALEVKATTGVEPQMAVREGARREQLLKYISEDHDIRVLVLGASTENGGPGPLVSSLTGSMINKLRVPVTVVPGAMTLEEIDALC